MANFRQSTDGDAMPPAGAEMIENLRRAFPLSDSEDFTDLLRQIDERTSGPCSFGGFGGLKRMASNR
jgi:hypothetical protein